MNIYMHIYMYLEKGVAPSPTPWCCSYRKGRLLVTLDYGRQLYIYIFVPFLSPTSFDPFLLLVLSDLSSVVVVVFFFGLFVSL